MKHIVAALAAIAAIFSAGLALFVHELGEYCKMFDGMYEDAEEKEKQEEDRG